MHIKNFLQVVIHSRNYFIANLVVVGDFIFCITNEVLINKGGEVNKAVMIFHNFPPLKTSVAISESSFEGNFMMLCLLNN